MDGLKRDNQMKRKNIGTLLKDFFNKILAKNPVDVIILLQRKANSMLVALRNELPQIKRIQLLDSEYLNREQIMGKRVLIFDDLVQTGYSMQEAIEITKRFRPLNLITAALFVAKTSQWKPDFQSKLIEEDDLPKVARAISDYIVSLGRPIDTDNLILEVKFDKALSVKKVAESMRKLGLVYYRKTGKELAVITLEPKDELEVAPGGRPISSLIGDLPSFVASLRSKVRLYFRNEKFSSIVVTVFPVIQISYPRECAEFLQEGCFLKQFSAPESEITCLDCVRTKISFKLAQWFIRVFRELLEEIHNAHFVINSAEWTGIEQRYKSLTKQLRKRFVKGEKAD